MKNSRQTQLNGSREVVVLVPESRWLLPVLLASSGDITSGSNELSGGPELSLLGINLLLLLFLFLFDVSVALLGGAHQLPVVPLLARAGALLPLLPTCWGRQHLSSPTLDWEELLKLIVERKIINCILACRNMCRNFY